MAKIFRGAQVRQVVKVIQGVVTDFKVDQESGDRLIGVEYTEDGEKKHRYFSEGQVELVPEEPKENPAEGSAEDPAQN